MREEWDWTFRSVLPALNVGMRVTQLVRLLSFFLGACDFEERPAACGDQWCEAERLVGPRAIRKKPHTELHQNHGSWMNDNSGPSCLFSEDAAFEEQTVKIYEDFLSDLGIASLYCRCRHGPRGFELRVRWFIPVRHALFH